jgi:hypothetical protein
MVLTPEAGFRPGVDESNGCDSQAMKAASGQPGVGEPAAGTGPSVEDL